MKTSMARVGCLLVGLLASAAVASSKNPSTAQTLKMEEPLFPTGMLFRGVTTGEVRLVISIDPEGKLTDWLLVSYTRPEFADSVVKALKNSHFDPVMVNGEAAYVRLPLSVNFEARGVVISTTMMESIENRMEASLHGDRHIQKTSTPRDLDSVPKLRHVVSPRYPEELAKNHTGGSVVLDFFIDETGKVRMPTLDGGDQLPFANAAAAALEEWQFDPPTRGGEPVTVRVKQKFYFPPKA